MSGGYWGTSMTLAFVPFVIAAKEDARFASVLAIPRII